MVNDYIQMQTYQYTCVEPVSNDNEFVQVNVYLYRCLFIQLLWRATPALPEKLSLFCLTKQYYRTIINTRLNLKKYENIDLKCVRETTTKSNSGNSIMPSLWLQHSKEIPHQEAGFSSQLCILVLKTMEYDGNDYVVIQLNTLIQLYNLEQIF